MPEGDMSHAMLSCCKHYNTPEQQTVGVGPHFKRGAMVTVKADIHTWRARISNKCQHHTSGMAGSCLIMSSNGSNVAVECLNHLAAAV
jgi:hypothetical protein